MVWYASEAFGDLASVFKKKDEAAKTAVMATELRERIAPDDAMARLRAEYDRKYFVTGAALVKFL
jgi:hypothetical protein